MALMELYGAGCWSGWLRFLTPLRTREKRFAAHVRSTADAYRRLKAGNAEWYPLAVRPEPGGLLPFANSVDADWLGWLTEGDDTDAWPLIVWPRHADQGPPLGSGLVDTLLAWQRGRFRTAGLAGFDQEEPRGLRPLRTLGRQGLLVTGATALSSHWPRLPGGRAPRFPRPPLGSAVSGTAGWGHLPTPMRPEAGPWWPGG
ncbi:hypothetical protein PV364_31610 [Streptomyces sp. MI02-7b]|nr:hypothetical protein [Streptomyces sp. MI02-7b]